MEKKYPNILIAGLYATQKGGYISMAADDFTVEQLNVAFERGGKFYVRQKSPAEREKALAEAKDQGKPEYTVPVAYLEFVPAKEVANFRNNRPQKQSGPKSGL